MYCKSLDTHEPIIEHDFLKLYKDAHETVDKEYGIPKPNPEVVQFVERLGKFDQLGQVFRYPESKEGKDFYENIDLIFRRQIISLFEIKKIAEKVFGDLEGLEGYLDYQKEIEKETLSNL